MTLRQENVRRSLRRIFAVPLLIGLISAVGLVAALVGDDIWDAIGWLCLGIPVAVFAWCAWRPRRTT